MGRVHPATGEHKRQTPYLIQASGAYRAAPGPTVGQDWHLARLSSGRGDEVVLLQTYPEMRADAFHPLQNRWRELAPPSRDSEWFGDGIGEWVTCRGLGSTIMLIGGDVEPRMPIDVYDASQDTWSRRPDFPLCEPGECYSKAVEVDGKLWLYALDDHLQETFVYDPATQTWTAGPRLPHELHDEGGVHWHQQAFELAEAILSDGPFPTGPQDVRYLAFIWDPIREAWDEAPFPVPPVVALCGDSIDNHLVVSGHVDSSDPTGRISTRRLFVLRPDSRDWGASRRMARPRRSEQMQVTAVRLGRVIAPTAIDATRCDHVVKPPLLPKNPRAAIPGREAHVQRRERVGQLIDIQRIVVDVELDQ